MDYPQPDGHSRLLTLHAPNDVYAYILDELERRGVARNKAITEIIREHRDAALKREARAKR